MNQLSWKQFINWAFLTMLCFFLSRLVLNTDKVNDSIQEAIKMIYAANTEIAVLKKQDTYQEGRLENHEGRIINLEKRRR